MGCDPGTDSHVGLLQQRFLQQVQTPARYLGLEHNSIVKDAASVRARFALCYPDTYEIGMSHLGSLILYSVINSHPEVWCERAYHPWLDATELMRREGLPLTSLESHTPLAQFDLVGLTLQHELNYTAALSLLDLAQITLRAAERRPAEPLVIAGGPCAYNPEPVATSSTCSSSARARKSRWSCSTPTWPSRRRGRRRRALTNGSRC